MNAPRHAVSVFGMSGVGKTRLSALLRKNDWFHYSLDYRIGTRYMGEHIVDNFKYQAMKVPFLRDLLRSDSIFISSNITFSNLDPLSTYLGAPGDPKRGGLGLKEYQRRQELHRTAEIAALLDIPYFLNRAKTLYGYDDFIADTGGSLIEVIKLDDPSDPVVESLTANTVLLYIKGTDDDAHALIKRYEKAPKPMYYRPDLLVKKWAEFKRLHHIENDHDVDPARFAVWGYQAILQDRLPRYQTLADRHGYVINAADLCEVRDGKDFLALMQKAFSQRRAD
ncbi:ATPases of the AAA+ class [hydrothermal vent metagenome]|uniref:ATPases of the AAA+ class n=1 Tax=hydrothermal vent metagenome TaxID=652676 RepID=A0A3B0U2A5_9ZZZZ